ncbi:MULTISPECIES: type I restriction endonuclease [Methylosinus]|uniref:Restriction endonuclease n=1 Tax=Methylosinus trichosporium (strain ATCC 35070 / NCIMB 11131 / UNIQEM 75 / OB3b) TaxID=595536 RepID=A0A2D2D4V7_METT3|nr:MULTISPECIES: type I restriction endonuclease [Methylosinus]ATQ70050.1 restriction endonuclease [Methylosinus trichosporium OB3b]OBS53041.1 restriction endonuclease [Methylosinus sp. 3S-1]
MDFADKIAALSERISKQKDSIETEEATKNAFIMPFISALGYDVFNPHEVVPEFTADVGVKKGEKVDYAIKINGKVAMLIECKPCRESLSAQHMSQLFRYFSVVEARFSILTNGIKYWFFTDLDNKNKMDSKPFFEFDILNYRSAQIEELKKFTVTSFDETTILGTASDLKYGSLLTREINSEIESPSEEVTRMLIARVYEGKLTANVLAKFGPLVQKAMKDTVRELVNQRLTSAIDDSTQAARSESTTEAPSQVVEPDEIVTTQEEIDGYQIVRAILREVIKVDRIAMRDSKTYCAILLDDNNRKPICRLHFNRSVKYIGLFDQEKNEERVRIESLDDIFIHADRLKATIRSYDRANLMEAT